MLAILFCISVLAILHTYVLYPFVLLFLDAVEQARSAWRYIGGWERRRPPAQLGLPHVSVLVSAHDEASCIGRRIENLLAQDYPADKLEIVVGSDGSTDATDSIVQHYASRGVKLSRGERVGKAGVLARLIGLAKGEVKTVSSLPTQVAVPSTPKTNWFHWYWHPIWPPPAKAL